MFMVKGKQAEVAYSRSVASDGQTVGKLVGPEG